jgi:gas vesicle protein
MSNRTFYTSSEVEKLARWQKVSRALSFTMGVGVGAAAALLFAPNDGGITREKTRDMLASAMDEGMRQGRDLTGKVREQLNEELPHARERVGEVANKVRS